VDAVGTVISMLEDDKKLQSAFVGKTYVPFMVDMKKNGHLEVFGRVVLYVSGDTSVRPWLAANEQKFAAFLSWAKAYQPRR
jgi:hypothetical protein